MTCEWLIRSHIVGDGGGGGARWTKRSIFVVPSGSIKWGRQDPFTSPTSGMFGTLEGLTPRGGRPGLGSISTPGSLFHDDGRRGRDPGRPLPTPSVVVRVLPLSTGGKVQEDSSPRRGPLRSSG